MYGFAVSVAIGLIAFIMDVLAQLRQMREMSGNKRWQSEEKAVTDCTGVFLRSYAVRCLHMIEVLSHS